VKGMATMMWSRGGGGDGDGVKWIPALTSGETSCAPGSEGGMQACDGGHAGGAWSCTGA
jgi:hypothetical protein